MAGKDDFDLDNLDIDEFSFGDDEYGPGPSSDDRKPITKVASSFAQGVKDVATDPNFLKKTVTSALPKGYDKAIEVADEAAELGRDLYNSAAKEIKPALNDMKRATRAIMPKLRPALPKGLMDKLDKFLEEEESRAERAREEDQETQITLELGQIFKAREEAEAEREARQAAETKIRDNIGGKQHEQSIAQLDAVRRGIDRLVGYQDSVTVQYQRKSLELQYRQFFVLRDTLEHQKATTADVLTNLQAISKNTGLPEFVKINQTESFSQYVRERLYGSMADSFADYSRNFKKNLANNIKSKVMDHVQQFSEGLSTGASMLESVQMMSEMGEGMPGGFSAKEMAAGMAGNSLMNKLGATIGGWGKKRLEKYDGVRRVGAELGYAASDLPAYLNDFAKGSKGEEGPLGWLVRGFKELIPTYNKNSDVSSQHGQNYGMAVPYDLLTKKSIVEIIPGYLSRILRELEITRTGDESTDLLLFNHDRDQFSRSKQVGKDILNKLFSKDKVSSTNQDLDNITDRMLGNAKVSKQAREALKTQLFKDAQDGVRFSADRYGSEEFLSELKPADRKRVAAQIRARFGLKGGKFKDAKGAELQGSVGRLFSGFRSSIDSPRAGMLEYADLGYRDVLRDLGFFVQDGVEDTLDYDKVTEVYRKGRVEEGIGKDDEAKGSRKNSHHARRSSVANSGIRSNDYGGAAADSSKAYRSPDIEDVIRETNQSLIDAINSTRIVDETNYGNQLVERVVAILESGALAQGGGQVSLNLGKFGNGAVNAIKNGGKRVFGAIGNVYSGMFEGLGKALNGAGDLAGGLLSRAGNFVKGGAGDVYVKGEHTPALYGYKMKRGAYYVMRGKKRVIIKSISDITNGKFNSPVFDSEDADNVALSLEQIRKGIYDTTGRGLLSKGLSAVGNFYLGMFKPVTTAIGFATDIVKSGINFITRQKDIYVKGETVPRILANVLEAGGYFSEKTGEVVRNIKDFDGNIVDANGNIVLSLNDMRKGLVDRWGSEFKGLGGKLVDFVKKGVTLPFTIGKKLYGLGMSVMEGGAQALGSLLGIFNDGMNGGKKQTTLLEEIRNILDERLPSSKKKFSDSDGDGDRDGSWQDQFSKKRKRKGKGGGKKGGIPGARSNNADSKSDEDGEDGVSLDDISTAMDIASGAGDLLGKAGKWIGETKLGGFLARSGTSLLARIGIGSAASAAGGALASGGMLSAIGSGLAGAGAVIGGIISSPVVLTIGAIAGVGALGYMGYKYFTEKKVPLAKVRFAQYGIDAGDEDEVKAIVQFEERLMPNVKYQKGTAAELSPNGLKLEEFLDLFGVDKEDEDDVVAWLRWFSLRFKPVFQNHAGMLHEIAPQVKLHEVDDKLTKVQKLDFLKRVKFDTNSANCPYNIEEGPFGDADTDVEDVQEAFEDALEEVNDLPDDPEQKSSEMSSKMEKGATTGILASASKIVGDFGKGVADGLGISEGARSLMATVAKYALAAVGGPATAMATMAVKGYAMLASFVRDTKLDALTCVRLKTYGLVEMDIDKVKALLQLEDEVFQEMEYDGKGVAEFKGDPAAYLKKYASQFGVDAEVSSQASDWLAWFSMRFLPAMVALATALHSINPAIGVAELKSRLKPEQMMELAQAIIAAVTEAGEAKVSVWTIDKSPWPGYALNKNSKSTDGNVGYLRKMIKRTEYDETVEKEEKKTATSNLPLVYKREAYKGGFATYASPMAVHRNAPIQGNGVFDRIKSGTYAADLIGGRQVIHPGNGTGGDVNQIPQPKGDGSWGAVKDTILAAAKMAGVDPALMATMASIESGYRATVKAGTSSATGLYQFIKGTWDGMLKKYGAKYGIAPDTPPSDPRANALMGAEFLKENSAALEKALNRKPTDTDLYLAHFMGAGGAIKLLKGDPNAIAAQLNPEAAKANKSIFYADGRARTLAEVYAEIDRRVRGHSDNHDAATSSAPMVAANDAGPTSTEGAASTSQPAGSTSFTPIGVLAPSSAPSTTPATASVAASDISTAPSYLMKTGATPTVVEERKVLAERMATATDVQSKAVNESINGGLDAVVDVLNRSLQTQQSMDQTLKEISNKMSTGSQLGSGAPAPTYADGGKPSGGKRPFVAQSKQAPISVKQVS